MTFSPNIGDPICIGSETYYFEPNPAAGTFVYKQTGKKGTVFQIANRDQTAKYALKVFHPAYRTVEVVRSAESIAQYQSLVGLQVCSRVILRKETHGDLVSLHPELEFAVFMPWIEGDTWEDNIFKQQPLSADESFQYGQYMAAILAGLEMNGLAHCDIAGANVILCDGRIELVDVEDMFGPGFSQPTSPPAGQDGYAFRYALPKSGLWCAAGDRFAGAVILTETLLWHHQLFRDKRDSSAFFSKSETLKQEKSERYLLAQSLLRSRYGSEVAGLFEAAWFSQSLADCPTLTQWYNTLNSGVVDESQTAIEDARPIELPSAGPGGGAFGEWGRSERSPRGQAPVLPSPVPGSRLKLNPLELALLIIGLPMLGVCAVISLTPVLTQNTLVVDYLWGDLPLIALVPPILHAAYKRLWATVAGYLATAIVSGLVVQLLVGTFSEGAAVDLLAGSIISGLLIALLYWLADKYLAVGKSGARELIALMVIVTIATTVLYFITFWYIPIFIWLAPVFCLVGWAIGDRVRRTIIHWRDPSR
jgi:hypothetical protein